ncbi:MAG: hypothetical protein U0996_00855 [Planctomycetaceae bacterium]
MTKHLMAFGLILVGVCSSAVAGDRFYFSHRTFVAPPVVYGAPVVAYQPAYIVPTPTVTVASYPVSTVTYSTHYFAPMVPVVPTTVVAAPVVAAPVVASPVILPTRTYVVPARHGRFRRYRGVEVEFERDGDIEIDYR